MSDPVPGLTCAACHGELYPSEAQRTDEGWRHTEADRRKCSAQRRSRQQQERREDIEWMAETGETFSGVAKRLGISIAALDRWLRHNDLLHIHRTLLARDPGATNARRRTAA